MPNKRALLVGINKYSQAQFSLRGCVNDIDSLAALLKSRFGFNAADMKRLIDDAATRDNILAAVKDLVHGLGQGDTLIFGYSGHGTQLQGAGDTGPVEAIVPYEASLPALISNSDINGLIRQALKSAQGGKLDPGTVSITAIYDCCHSGFMFRSLKLLESGSFTIAEPTEQPIINRFLDLNWMIPNLNKQKEVVINPFSVLSACKDEETAADLLANPQKDAQLTEPRGAFSFALHSILNQTPQLTPQQLELQVLPKIQIVTPHAQTPQYAAFDKGAPIFTVPKE